MTKILFVSKANIEFASHGISNLLLGEKTVRTAKGGAPNSFGKMGEKGGRGRAFRRACRRGRSAANQDLILGEENFLIKRSNL